MALSTVKISFRQEILEIPLERLILLKEADPKVIRSRKCKHIKASLEHVGLIEPLAVFPQPGDLFLVVNGNLRLHLLRELGTATARCTVALDDETYTYNKRVNPLSPITEHFMILKAIANGVTEERIATGLNVDVKAIRIRRSLLDGICPEAIDILKEKRVGSRALSYLRKMKPLRQIEAAELMVSGKNYTSSFAAAILGVTLPDQLIKSSRENDQTDGADTGSFIKETTDDLVSDLAVVRRTHGVNVLTLVVTCRCIDSLIQNVNVKKYLQHNHPEILAELKNLVALMGPDAHEYASPGGAA